jgi:hypothetical protein
MPHGGKQRRRAKAIVKSKKISCSLRRLKSLISVSRFLYSISTNVSGDSSVSGKGDIGNKQKAHVHILNKI